MPTRTLASNESGWLDPTSVGEEKDHEVGRCASERWLPRGGLLDC